MPTILWIVVLICFFRFLDSLWKERNSGGTGSYSEPPGGYHTQDSLENAAFSEIIERSHAEPRRHSFPTNGWPSSPVQTSTSTASRLSEPVQASARAPSRSAPPDPEAEAARIVRERQYRRAHKLRMLANYERGRMTL
jgi:hypothetical protein